MLSTTICKSWILRSVGGVLLGLLASYPVILVLDLVLEEPLLAVVDGNQVAVSLCIFSLGGLGLTLAQWTMLKTHLSHGAWWIAGSLGWGVGAGYFGVRYPIDIWPWLVDNVEPGARDGIYVTLIIAWMIVLGGTSCGMIQWPLLRNRPGSRGWLWLGAAGGVVTLVVGFSTSFLLGVGGAFLGGLLGAAVIIVLSGITISSILSES